MNFSSAVLARAFILAGDALFTIRSLKTGDHYTYRVQRASNADRWFVNVLSAPDQFTYIGVIDGSPLSFRTTGKSSMNSSSIAVRAFVYAFGWVSAGTIPDNLEIKHAGKCGRCGKTLTNPVSIDRGIGPDCFTAMMRA